MPETGEPLGRDAERLQPLIAQPPAAREANARTLGVSGSDKHVLTVLATTKLTDEQLLDRSLDLLTGFHLIDSQAR